MRQRTAIKIFFPVILIIGIYFLGPAPEKPRYDKTFPSVPAEALSLERFIDEQESQHKLKPDNEARIIWNDSTRSKTPFAIVYLHGFSASQEEGNPVHKKLAAAFGCNLYLSRLSDHGVDTTDALQLFTADRVWESAKKALAIGEAIGEKVILVSTSTGGTLALKLAADYPEKVHALINLSPNIAINNAAAFVANNPWGLYIGRLVVGGKYNITDPSEEKSKYWNGKYRLESVVQLEELLESTMTDETFKRITQPCLTLYYYKNEQEQDPEVKVSAMLDMHAKISTPDSLKVAVAIPNAGAHVLGSAITSKDVESVYRAMEKFMIEKVNVKKIPLTVANR